MPSVSHEMLVELLAQSPQLLPPLPQRRARGIGSRFAAPTPRKREMMR